MKTDFLNGVSLDPKVPHAPQAKKLEDLEKASKQFESMFMNIVLKQMREANQESGLFEDSNQREVFQGMLDEEYSKMSGEDSKMGLSTMIFKNMLRNFPELKAEADAKAAAAAKANPVNAVVNTTGREKP